MLSEADITAHRGFTADRMKVMAATLDEASEVVLLDVHPESDTMASYVARKLASEHLHALADTARSLGT